MNIKSKARFKVFLVLLLAAITALIANPKPTGISWLDNLNHRLKINLGLDLEGGVHLVYKADMSSIEKGKESEALSGVQDVIEKRINAYGVAEPVIQTSKAGNEYRLIVELAGVKDLEEAKNVIKETPFLEFKEQDDAPKQLTQEQQQLVDQQIQEVTKINEEAKTKADEILKKALSGDDFAQLVKDNSEDPGSKDKDGDLGFFKKGAMILEFEQAAFSDNLQSGQIYPELVKTSFGHHIIKKIEERGEGDSKEVHVQHILFKVTDPEELKAYFSQQLMQPEYKSTGLSGKELSKAQMTFDPQTNLPVISLQFNDSGKELFKEITERNLNKPVAIFLDNKIISSPVVQDVIRNGQAVINGKFTVAEAKQLAQRLNAGALPVPVTLIGQQSVEATLGKASLAQSLKAGAIGLLAVAVFMILYYRLAGLVAVLALSVYVFLMVSIFKLSSLTPLSITLTLSGIAGFVLSVGMAVDANVLIFERMKEELVNGRDLKAALREGFRRAWPSIRDGNYSTILTCLILMIFGSGFIKGFALILILGILVSMFTAIVVTRILLGAILTDWFEKHRGIVVRVKAL